MILRNDPNPAASAKQIRIDVKASVNYTRNYIHVLPTPKQPSDLVQIDISGTYHTHTNVFRLHFFSSIQNVITFG